MPQSAALPITIAELRTAAAIEGAMLRSPMRLSRTLSGITGAAQTVAEGIAVKAPRKLPTPVIRELVSDIFVVREATIEHALAVILEIEKTLVEGAAAALLAALPDEPARFAGKKIGLVMSGGNIDMRLLSSLILRELVREDRILSPPSNWRTGSASSPW